MKKIIVVLCCVILCMNLGGCIRPMNRGERLTKELGSEQQMADQMMEDIAAALDNGDADALKSLFSKTALEEATDIDQQIEDLINFYQGKMESYEGNASSSTDTHYGAVITKELKGHYILTTEFEQYRVAYQYKPIDKSNSDQEGLLSMEIVTDTTYQKDEFRWQYADNAGVYIQK